MQNQGGGGGEGATVRKSISYFFYIALILFYDCAMSKDTFLRKGCKRIGRDVSKLVTGYDVPGVYREFVLTCSRWQFSSNRLDYAPHLSVFSSPNWLARIAIRAARLCIHVCLI